MAITICCDTCDYCTDIETTSDTNPRHCPECGGELYLTAMGERSDVPLYVDGELNPALYTECEEDYPANATNVQSVRDIIRAFLDVPKEALPSATYIDQDEPGDPWQDIRDYLTDASVAPGVEVRLHADRPEWKSVIVSLDPS